jgi:hypothetical protein
MKTCSNCKMKLKEWKAESEKWKSNGGTKISLKMGLVVPKRTLSCSFHQRRVKLSPSLFFETIAQLCSVLHEIKKLFFYEKNKVSWQERCFSPSVGSSNRKTIFGMSDGASVKTRCERKTNSAMNDQSILFAC